MKKKNYLFLSFLLISMTIIAQSYKVTGTVRDGSGSGIPGVSVVQKGTSNGTTTDFNGTYSIQIEQGDVLEFSYVGYTGKSIVMNGSKVINTVLSGGVSLEEIVLLGSRGSGRTIIDSPVPVDIIDVAKLSALGSQTTINEILNYVAPSFTSTTQTVADGTDHVDPASLRGLGPDQVLVLINGKRRHKSSLVNVNGTVGKGTVGTDMNSIPTAAIARIEVLRDGAAAQYGSDAVAGVINIVLKKATNELTINVNTGANISQHSEKYGEGGIDGEKFVIDANYGIDLGNNGGFINFTGSLETRGATNRSDAMGKPIYTMFDIATRNLGYDQAFEMSPSSLSAYVAGLDSSLQSVYDAGIANGDSFYDIIASNAHNGAVSNYELGQRGLTRDDFRMKVGQSKLRGGKFFMNMELPLNDNGAVLYSFGGMSYRDGLSAGFFRRPAYTDGRGTTSALENGFLPHISSSVKDKSFAVGIKGKIGDWNVDFSNTYGANSFDFTIKNTLNATLESSSPRDFEAGGFAFAQNTTNIDISKFCADTMEGLNIAFGAEYRLENYQEIAGEEASWASYDKYGEVVTHMTPDAAKKYSYFGELVLGGSQVFPGYRPENEVDQNRNSYAGYVDIEADISKSFLITAALRYENFSDFGDTFNWKLSTRYKITEDIALRAAVSTGFRAPDLHQVYFNARSTQFIKGVPTEVSTFSNNSRLADLLDIPKLKEETSRNFSLGLAAKVPDLGLSFSVDGYYIGVDDRVGLTRYFSSTEINSTPEIISIFKQAGAEEVQFFTNGYDTETTGIDIVITHKMDLGKGTLNNTLSAAFSETEVKDVKSVSGEEILDEKLKGFIEDAMPRTKINLTNNYQIEKWNVLLRNVYFGAVNDPDYRGTTSPATYAGKIITDLTVAYDFSKNLKLAVGANNLLDVYPDESPVSGNYGRQFMFSRRTSQFGFNGRYVFGRITFTLK